MDITRQFDILHRSADLYPDRIALAGKRKGEWVKYSFAQYLENVNRLSLGLMMLGVKKGDRIATISSNRPEWCFIDLAVMQLGAIHVPVGHSLPEEDMIYMVGHAGAKYFFTSFNHIALLFRSKLEEFSDLQEIICFDKRKGFRSIEQIMELGSKESASDLKLRMEAVSPDDTASMLFTSGTSNRPKGALISHRASGYTVQGVSGNYGLTHKDVAISFLPVSHALEQFLLMSYLGIGMTVYFLDSMVNMPQKLMETRPSFFVTVPLLIEKLFEAFVSRSETFSKEELEHTAKLAFAFDKDAPEKSHFTDKDRKVLKSWSNLMGGNLRMLACGGAPLAPRYVNAFWAMGIQLFEAYGMTENGILTINGPKNVRLGTVGSVFPSIKMRLGDDGEVLVKGPRLLQEYYRNEEANAEAFDVDGWFRTGDVGEWIDEKFLKLKGRKKDLFKISSGEYISPAQIEETLCRSELIDNCLVFEQDNEVALLVVPNSEALRKRIDKKDESLSVKKLIADEVDALYNSRKLDFEHITRIYIETRVWSVEENDLTPILKKRRNVIIEKYRQNLTVG